MNSKAELREAMRGLRGGLEDGPRREADCRIFERLTADPDILAADTVMTYVSMGSEADTYEFIRWAIGCGKRVAAPRVAGRELEVLYIDGFDSLEPGKFGVMEPRNGCGECRLSDIGAVIVPGLAFDCRGGRLGYGAGYYDRLLPRIGAVKEGVCFDFCVAEDVFAEPHDVPVDKIITDKRSIKGVLYE